MADDLAQTLVRKAAAALSARHYSYGLELSLQLTGDFPEFNFGWLYRGTFLFFLHRIGEAEEMLQIAVAKSDSDRSLAICHRQLGDLYTEMQRFELAEQSYCKAIALSPDDAWQQISLGIMYLRKGDYELAESAYWKATGCDDELSSEAYLNLSYLFRSSDRLEQGLACAIQAMKLKPQYAEAAELKEDLELAIRLRTEAK